MRYAALLALVVAPALAGDEEAALLRALGDPRQEVRHTAAVILAQDEKEAVKAVPILIESLQSDDWYTRWQACLGLCAFGPAAKKAVPALLPTLCDEQQDVCREALLALRQIAPKDKRVVLALGALLRADHPVDMSAFFFALDAAGDAARPAVVDLVDFLDREGPHTARLLRVLETCRPLPRTVILALRQSQNSEARSWARSWSLSGTTSEARETRETVGLLLRKSLLPETAVRLALAELLAEEYERRNTAAAGLREIGTARYAVVPPLIRLLGSDDKKKRARSRSVLRMIDAADIEKLVRTNLDRSTPASGSTCPMSIAGFSGRSWTTTKPGNKWSQPWLRL